MYDIFELENEPGNRGISIGDRVKKFCPHLKFQDYMV